MSEPSRRDRVVVVGAGFAGFHAARSLARLTKGAVEVVMINSTDYFLYLPLLPEVAAGILDPRRVSVPLAGNAPGVRLVLGTVDEIDLDARRVGLADPEGNRRTVEYDRLVLSVGSVNKLLPIPGVAEHAHGFRSLAEALYLRDHLVRQLELADVANDPAERDARCTFVVVGAGYTGTEVAAHGQLFTRDVAKRRPGLRGQRIRWLLLDLAPRVLPELDRRLSETARRVLTERGVDVRTGTSVAEATREGVKLSDGEFVATRSLIWCVGVRPDPLVEALGLPLVKGRLVVDEYLTVPGRPELWACGDAAAVPDLTRPGEITPMTAQHAVRQGKHVGHNLAAAYGHGHRQPYRHHDLGFVVDLAGVKAAANPLGLPLSGVPAKLVTRGYHLLSVPSNRVRIASDWLLDAVLPRQTVQLGLVRAAAVPLAVESERHANRAPGSGRQPGHALDRRGRPAQAVGAESGPSSKGGVMFVQVIQGRALDVDGIRSEMDRWTAELQPGAEGWLGSTAGVTDDGRFVALARFESEEAARRNSERPEQDAWWRRASQYLGEVAFHNSARVHAFKEGGSDEAGFVQVVQGHTDEMERLAEFARSREEVLAREAPHILGMTVVEHADRPGDFTQAVYFTSEEEARRREQERPMESDPEMAKAFSLMSDLRYFDLRDPWLQSPR